MAMHLVFLGPPGAGKGTHARILGEKYGLAHLATGDILRQEIREKTPLGQKAQSVIERGELVCDDLVNEMMFNTIEKHLKEGFVLDGYPRTLGQAESLTNFLNGKGLDLDAAINFVTSEEVIVDRLSGRRVCPKCGRNYHVRNMPPLKEGICDDCGTPLIQRKDDNPETIKHRLAVYHAQTEPVLEYYRQKGLLHEVKGDLDVPELQEELKRLFESLKILQ